MLQKLAGLMPERDLAERVADLERVFDVDMAALSAPVAAARSACDSRAAERGDARRAYAAVAGKAMPGVSIDHQPVEVQAAWSAAEKAEARLRAARDALGRAREVRNQVFARIVRERLTQSGDTLADVADAVNHLVVALSKLHAVTLQHGLDMPQDLQCVPMIAEGARLLTAVANRATS